MRFCRPVVGILAVAGLVTAGLVSAGLATAGRATAGLAIAPASAASNLVLAKWQPNYPSTPLPKIGKGMFRLRVVSDLGALRIREHESMVVEISRADGKKVGDAQISVAAKARDVERRMLTVPQLTANLGAGRYKIEGLLFSMNGSWLLEFQIRSGAVRDRVLLEVVLK